MATIAAAPPYTEAKYDAAHTGIWSWLTTVDHKRIGALYLVSALFFFVVGGLEASIMRAQLMKPNGTVVSAEMFNQLFTMHGTTMVFLAIMPMSAAFFNFLIPLQIGARDVAFPRLNAFSYWVYVLGGIFISIPIVFGLGPNGGWFGYAPLSTKAYSPQINMDFLGAWPPDPGHFIARGGVQLHHDDHQHACARHVAHAHADLHVDVVRGAVPGGAGVPGDHCRARVPAVRPLLRHELLHDRQGRRPAAVAAPVLGVRTS
jgi:hypothetical protein